MMYLLSKMGDASSKPAASSKRAASTPRRVNRNSWPSQRHPPPRDRPATHAPHAAQEHAPDATPAEEASHPEHEGGPSVHLEAPSQPFVAPGFHLRHAPQQHDATSHSEPLGELHHAPPDPAPAGQHVEQHHDDGGSYLVADLQRILVGLGWRGAGTTQGPLHRELTDGLYGPVTAADWAQSARKRQLDTTFVRLDARHAHVSPQTYNALRSLAKERGAAVVGSRRRVYIP